MTESNDVRIPTPEPISLRDHPLENIRYFKRQWKYFCISTGLNRLSEAKKVATLFLFMGREALTFIHEKLELSSEEMNDCDRILAALEASHRPQNVIYQRFLFHQTAQNANTVDQFVNKLRTLAEHCRFEDQLEEMIRDRFIIGLRNKEIQKELLSKSELSLSNAVRICKRKELEDVRLSNEIVDGEIVDRVLSVDVNRQVESSVKVEKLDEDDDLIILNHYQKDSVSFSNRGVKKLKLEPLNDENDEEFDPPIIDVESDRTESRDASSAIMKLDSFVVSKVDWNTLTDPPIYKIDTPALLQKFIPIEYNGITLHKSTAVYSGWSVGDSNNYYKAPVQPRPKQSTKRETVVLFLKDRVPIENQFENVMEITPKNST